MVLYFLLTTYNSNAFSLLLTPYYFTTYYLTTYYLLPYYLLPYYLTTYSLLPYYLLLTTLLPYYLLPYYLTTYYLTTYYLLLTPASHSQPPRTVRRTIQFRTARLADLLKSDREANLVRVPS